MAECEHKRTAIGWCVECGASPACVIDALRAELHALAAKYNALERAARDAEYGRDEARKWVRRMHRESHVLTCVYCGHAYPPGTPQSGSDVLTEHVRQCEKHPMRAVERKLAIAVEALESLERTLWPSRDGGRLIVDDALAAIRSNA